MDRQSIGSYKVVRELGQGAMGVVYEGFDPAIGRSVAIKVIRPRPDMTADESAQLRQRLIREASAAGKLSHPNLVTIYQLGEEGQEVFIAMEFVKGSGLRQVMDAGIERDRCLEILRQAAEGLDFAHRAGVLHRDIKPDNILIREDGCVKIADFGIAKIIENSTQTMTMAGTSLGSPMYMSPEQVKAEQMGTRSDQFSLAVVAFEMLTGHKPFAGDNMAALMYQILMADPLAAPEVRATLSPTMIPAFARALAKSPEERFPNCSEFVRALSQTALSQTMTPVVVATPAENRPAPLAVVAAPSAPKQNSRMPLIAGVACLVVLVAAGVYWAKKSATASSGANASGTAAKVESPVVKALAEGRLDDARKLLDGGADINGSNPDGTTPLMQAAEGSAYLPNNLPAVQMLLDKKANLEAEDRQGRTALMRAIAEGKDDAVQALLGHKADPNHRASDGASVLLTAVSYGKLPFVKQLITAGSNIETANNSGMTPLMLASQGSAYMPNNLPFVQVLLDKGAKIDPVDKQGRSALFLAAEEGKTDAVNLLMDQKADPNQKNNNGETPLLMAVTYGKTETVKTLLKRGANVDAADASGNTALMRAAENNAYVPNNGPLVQLLLEAGAKVEPQDSRGRSALYRAAADGKEDAIGLLLEKKADINQRPSDGTTPLMAAVESGKQGTVKLLLDHGADVNVADPNGRTALMFVADGGPYIPKPGDMATLLLAKGAKKDVVDAKGQTALAHATEAKNAAVIDLLKQ